MYTLTAAVAVVVGAMAMGCSFRTRISPDSETAELYFDPGSDQGGAEEGVSQSPKPKPQTHGAHQIPNTREWWLDHPQGLL